MTDSPADSLSLNLIVLRAADLAKAEVFYSCLGLNFIRHRHGNGPEHLSAELGGCVFELYPQSMSESNASTLGTRIGFRVLDLDATLLALADFPESILSPPQNSPWGRRAVVADPDGHRVELVEG